MKKFMKGTSFKLMSLMSSMALFLAVSSVSSACFYWSYQPDVPKELELLEK